MVKRTFETLVLPHLDAAFNLARWLVRDDHIADDIVQDSFLRALRYFAGFRGDEARPWVLGIVRNNCYTWLDKQRRRPDQIELDDEVMESVAQPVERFGADPTAMLDAARTQHRVDAAIQALKPVFREVVVLREIEGLPYDEIAQVVGIPVGTVMSRLSRARAELKTMLADVMGQA